jgi:hypothetical protein
VTREWNVLPRDIREASSVNNFKNKHDNYANKTNSNESYDVKRNKETADEQVEVTQDT